jgi:hypothetical protein
MSLHTPTPAASTLLLLPPRLLLLLLLLLWRHRRHSAGANMSSNTCSAAWTSDASDASADVPPKAPLLFLPLLLPLL